MQINLVDRNHDLALAWAQALPINQTPYRHLQTEWRLPIRRAVEPVGRLKLPTPIGT